MLRLLMWLLQLHAGWERRVDHQAGLAGHAQGGGGGGDGRVGALPAHTGTALTQAVGDAAAQLARNLEENRRLEGEVAMAKDERHSPMATVSPMWEITTSVGILLGIIPRCGATPQILKFGLNIVEYSSAPL